MKLNTFNPQYYLLAQHPDDLIILGVKGQKYCLLRKAAEILIDAELLKGMSREDIKLIRIIDAMTLEFSKRRRKNKKN